MTVAFKQSGGGWSIELLFWWHLIFPQEVLEREILPNNKSRLLIPINVLEMVCGIINMASVIFVCDHDNIDVSSFPVLLNFCDNTAACSWVNEKCKHSMIGRRLGCLFVGLLMSTEIGVQAKWISTLDNFIADDLSRLKKEKEKGEFDYGQLKRTYPLIAPCRQFRPSNIF